MSDEGSTAGTSEVPIIARASWREVVVVAASVTPPTRPITLRWGGSRSNGSLSTPPRWAVRPVSEACGLPRGLSSATLQPAQYYSRGFPLRDGATA
jgi:hypothetical protein